MKACAIIQKIAKTNKWAYIYANKRQENMALKKIHFNERLKDFIDENYKSQGEFGKDVGRSQPTVARWCDDPNFAASESVRKALRKLEAKGVNPEFFWNPLVTDWHAPRKTYVDELEFHDLKKKLEVMSEDRDRLMRQIVRLEDELSKCLEKKNPRTS